MTSTEPSLTRAAGAPAELEAALEKARSGLVAARDLLGSDVRAGLSEGVLLEIQHALAGVKREADVAMAPVCAEIARRSSADQGAGGLARKQGFTNPGTMIAAATGGSRREAERLIRAGRIMADAQDQERREQEAASAGTPPTAPEEQTYPVVASALAQARLSTEMAGQITRMLDSVGGAVSREQIAIAERRLVERAPGLTAEQFAPIVMRWRFALVERDAHERQERLAKERYLVIRDEPDGAVRIDGRLDPVTAAPIRAALEGMVKDTFRRRRDGDEIAEDRRPAGQIRADALATFARHMLGCAEAPAAHATTRVIVRMTLDQLREACGIADVDGAGTGIPAAQVRRAAVDAGYVPVVLDGDGQVLDVGREKRRFTPAQVVALLERDGGCAMCGAPPSHCEAHHIEWWTRDAGRTDLSNGVMLCVACHHTIHRDAWEIDASMDDVWFRPPIAVDPRRRPRLGGRARFGVTQREQTELDGAASPPLAPPSAPPLAQSRPPTSPPRIDQPRSHKRAGMLSPLPVR